MSRPILKLNELVPGVYAWRRASNGGIVPFHDSRGAQGLLLIDTGADNGAVEGLLEWVKRFAATQVVIANTHNHSDHTWGNGVLIAHGAHLLTAARDDLNHLAVKCIPMPGHSPDSQAVMVKGVAFAGDAAYTPDILHRMPIPAYVDVAQGLSSLTALEAWLEDPTADRLPPAERWLVAGHGRPLQGDDALAAVAATRAGVERALAVLDEVMGPPGYGPAPAPDDDDVKDWLVGAGTSAQHAAALGTWRRVAAGYAGELARRRSLSAR